MRSQPIQSRRRAMVLLVVLVVVALLALGAGAFARMMLAERRATDAACRRSQARALAESGLDMARMFVVQEKEYQDELGSWYDNPTQFCARAVTGDDAGGDAGRFTIIASRTDLDYEEGIRYGLEDDSVRLNINAVMAFEELSPGTGRTLLMALPGMTEDIADAILDWLDADDEPREYGAEFDYYSSLDPPYAPKNGPLESIEELLLVRGIAENPALLLGVDLNRNGLVDLNEPDSQSIPDVDNSDLSMNRGWSAYLTLFSFETNLTPEGEPKIFINQDDLEALYEELTEILDDDQARFIIAYRLGSDYDTGTTDEEGTSEEETDAAAEEVEPTPIADVELDMTQEPQRTVASLFDLVGAMVSMDAGGGEEETTTASVTVAGAGQTAEESTETVVESPFTEDPSAMETYLPTLLDYLTVVEAPMIMGRININQAPRRLLEGLGLTPEVVDEIIAERIPDPIAALDVTGRDRPTWIYTEGFVTLDEMKALFPMVTAGGSVYRAQVIGYFDRGGPSVRIEAVFDTSPAPAAARILSWRDISNLGRGYTPDVLNGVTSY